MHCFICNKVYLSLNDLLHHFENEHNLGSSSTYRCLEGSCIELFDDLASFKKHILRKHTDLIEQICPSKDELKALLKSWNQEYLLDHLIDEKISVEILKIIKRHHIWQLLKTFKMGQIIFFEHHLETWRRNIGLPLGSHDFSPYLHEDQASSNCSLKDAQSLTTRRYSPYDLSEKKDKNTSIAPSTYTDPKISVAITLSDILNVNLRKAQLITNFYEKNKELLDQQRKILINMIARYFEENNLHLSLSVSYRLENEIIERFPTEKIEFYRQGRTGKIYAKFWNLKRSFRSINQSEDKSDKNDNDSQNIDPESQSDFEIHIEDIKCDYSSAEEFESA